MPTRLNPYLSFRDTARESMEFYRSVFGGDLSVSTFGESGMGTADEADLVMHSQLEAPGDLLLMGADTPSSMEVQANGTVSLSGDDSGELRRYWDLLSAGATVVVPLDKAPWGDWFGMLTDRYGVAWMVNIADASDGT